MELTNQIIPLKSGSTASMTVAYARSVYQTPTGQPQTEPAEVI